MHLERGPAAQTREHRRFGLPCAPFDAIMADNAGRLKAVAESLLIGYDTGSSGKI